MMNDNRPDPDALLKAITDQENKDSRGKLRIFFGGCAGVGKTYAMLNAGHQRKAEGVNVLLGLVETHGRDDTEKLVAGLAALPAKEINHRGVLLTEFDIDEALKLKPSLILLDEMAHSNAPGSRHPKRWQDIEELLDAGIDVFTTLNVQHLESVNDIVAGITGIWVKETVPDKIFDQADDITLIDIPVDELLKRLSQGKVYIAQQAKDRAAQNFFKKNNLMALRELALRRTAERVDKQMDEYQASQFIEKKNTVSAAEKILVCIGPDAISSRLLRTSKRLATGFKAPWTVVYVENQRHHSLSKKARTSLDRTMRLAESLGAKTDILHGQNAMREIVEYAKKNNFSKIVVGKVTRSPLKDFLKGSLADEIMRNAGEIDVHVVSSNQPRSEGLIEKTKISIRALAFSYISAFTVPVIATLICSMMNSVINDVNLLMIYVIGAVLVATKFGKWPTVFCSLFSIFMFKFFFIEPAYKVNIEDFEFLIAALVMLLTSLIILRKTNLLSDQLKFSRGREHNTSLLYAITRELATTRGHKNMADVSAKHVAEVFKGRVLIFLKNKNDDILRILNDIDDYKLDPRDESAANWCFQHNQYAGKGTNTMPSAKGIYAPIVSSQQTIGVLGVIPEDGSIEYSIEQMDLLEAFANLISGSFERATSADLAEKSRVGAEMEKLRGRLLGSVSDDLKSPISFIKDAAIKIMYDVVSDEVRQTAKEIKDETNRLSRLVDNLLEVKDLENGVLKLNRKLFFIEEIIGSALVRCERRLGNRELITDIEDGLPMVSADALLIEQVVISFLENAAKRGKPTTPITISARLNGDNLVVSVADKGRKINPEEIESAIKSQNNSEYAHLTVANEIIQAHGGRVWAETLHNEGVRFCLSLKKAG